MRVYVAAKFQEKERVRALYQSLRAHGHTVTHDWTNEEDDPTPQRLTKAALDDVQGVKDADALVVLPHATGKGLYVELGVALGTGTPVIAVGDPDDEESIFLRLHPSVSWVPDESVLLPVLKFATRFVGQ